jgi:hypothetical protein
MSQSVHLNISLYIEDSDMQQAVINRICDDYGVSESDLLMDCESYVSHRRSEEAEGECTETLEEARIAWGWEEQQGDSVGEMGAPVWRDLDSYCSSDEYTDWVVHSGECDDPEDTQAFLSYLIDCYLSL